MSEQNRKMDNITETTEKMDNIDGMAEKVGNFAGNPENTDWTDCGSQAAKSQSSDQPTVERERGEETQPDQLSQEISPDQPDQVSLKKTTWKARRTEMVAGLVVGALLVFGAGFGCGSLSAKNNKGQFRQQAVAEQRPGMNQDKSGGPGGQNQQDFASPHDGSQGPQERGGYGHGPGNWGGPDQGDSRQGPVNPADGNGSGNYNNGQPGNGGSQPGSNDNTQPGQNPGNSQDSTDKSKDSTGQSQDKTGQSKDKTSQSKDSTGQSKDKTDSSGKTTTQSKDSTDPAENNSQQNNSKQSL